MSLLAFMQVPLCVVVPRVKDLGLTNSRCPIRLELIDSCLHRLAEIDFLLLRCDSGFPRGNQRFDVRHQEGVAIDLGLHSHIGYLGHPLFFVGRIKRRRH